MIMDGGCLKKKIHQEMTYRDLDAKIDHLWSILFTTGYLTQYGKDFERRSVSAIPMSKKK